MAGMGRPQDFTTRPTFGTHDSVILHDPACKLHVLGLVCECVTLQPSSACLLHFLILYSPMELFCAFKHFYSHMCLVNDKQETRRDLRVLESSKDSVTG